MSGVAKNATIKPKFRFGPYVPINKRADKIIIEPQNIVDYYHDVSRTDKRLLGEILPDDSIVDVPSLVTPLLLKKNSIWPPRVITQQEKPQTKDLNSTAESNDIEVIKVISKDSNSPDIIEDNNPRYREVDEYIRATVVANLTHGHGSAIDKPVLAIPDYFRSSAGQFLVSIGLSRVSEFVIEENVKKIASRVRKGNVELVQDLDNMKSKLIEAKRFNSHYKATDHHECHHCAFKTDSPMILANHLDAPHRNNTKYYSCNWCNFKTKDTAQISFHTRFVHKKHRCHIEKPILIHCCRYCSFESNSKRKFTTHITKCEQSFQSESVQAPEERFDYPAVTSKFITQQDVRYYESSLKSLRRAAYNPHQIKVSSLAPDSKVQSILVLPRSHIPATISTPTRLQLVPLSKAASPYKDVASVIGNGSAGQDKTSDPLQQQQGSSHLMRMLANNGSTNNLPHNRTSILQHPKPQSVFVNGMSVVHNPPNIVMAPTNHRLPDDRSSVANDKPRGDSPPTPDDQLSGGDALCANLTFVICEICDSYIENLEQFKSHMQWTHRVRIHQKLLDSSRPPLSCQRCNWRFFTDQGLERHLLGSHGLVTTNMQDLADDDKDSGRCTVCGIRCPRKLVAHMRDVHKLVLKPAQLSYKCTVCSADFSLYRLFENHVYRVHSNSTKQQYREPEQQQQQQQVESS